MHNSEGNKGVNGSGLNNLTHTPDALRSFITSAASYSTQVSLLINVEFATVSFGLRRTDLSGLVVTQIPPASQSWLDLSTLTSLSQASYMTVGVGQTEKFLQRGA